MYTVTVTVAGGGGLHVEFSAAARRRRLMPAGADEATEEPDEGPSPIAPEAKELLWGVGAFLVLLVVMRLWLVPKVKQGMEARYGNDPRRATSAPTRCAPRRNARSPSTSGQLAAVRAEAHGADRRGGRQLEARARRASRPASTRRSPSAAAAAAAEDEAAKAAARATVEDAVVDVAAADRRAEHRPPARRRRRAPRRRRRHRAPGSAR